MALVKIDSDSVREFVECEADVKITAFSWNKNYGVEDVEWEVKFSSDWELDLDDVYTQYEVEDLVEKEIEVVEKKYEQEIDKLNLELEKLKLELERY